MAVCGGGDPEYAECLKQIPIFAAHGTNDRLVPVARSRSMAKAIYNAGGELFVYQEVPQAGHDVWNVIFDQEATWEWLFRQKGKKPRIRSRWYPVPKVLPWQSRLF